MKYKPLDSDGSFTTKGAGFEYTYYAGRNALNATHGVTEASLLEMTLARGRAACALDFVNNFDKGNQIKAMMLSRNRTLDLSCLLDEKRLPSLLGTSAAIAEYSLSLAKGEYEDFGESFCDEHQLRRIQIRELSGTRAIARLSAELESMKGNLIAVQADTISGLISALSQSMIQDLIPYEAGASYETGAQNLLRATHKLSIISLILNERYRPRNYLRSQPPCKKVTAVFRARVQG